ncbi:MAG: apolipoprotein N-acyltransferase [Bacillota bacterium]
MGLPFLNPQFAATAWIGLIPFLIAVENKSIIQSFKLGWILGVTFLSVSSNWLLEPIVNFSGYSLVISSLIFFIGISILALYFALFAGILKFLKQKFEIHLLILVPLTWTAVEFLRSLFSFQFLFVFLGYSQSFRPQLIQLAQVGGVYLITFIIVAVNTLLYLFLKKETRKEKLIYLGTAVLIIVFLMLYGSWQLEQHELTNKNIKVSLIQPNIPQFKKLDSDYYEQIVDKLITLSATEIENNSPDLLVWPETAVLRTYNLKKKFPYLNKYQTPLYVGGFIREGDGPLNSALLVNNTGEIINSYSKNILVPWGEYVPFPNLVPDFIETNLNHITPGTKAVEFELGEVTWIGAICSEILNSDYIRSSYHQNDFIINISNEAWFGDSSAPRQVLQAAIFRAVENQVPIVKVGNTGISGLINSQGQVIKKTKLLTTQTVTINLQLPTRKKTIYFLIGDIIGQLSLVITVILLLTTAYKKIN